jgi:outer membrane protein, multidrug efflux system
MRTRGICVLAAAALSGCMVGPDYVKPRVDTPDAFRFEVKDAQETANTQWWSQFGDPVLDSLIAESLTNNKSVLIAAANVEQAAAVLVQTRAPLYPQIGYGGSAAREKFSEQVATQLPSGVANPQNNYQVLATASWEIDLWGRVRRLTQAAQANVLATQEARRGVILSLVASVAGSYLQLRALDEQLVVSKRTLAAYGESVRIFELRLQHGQASQMNVEQANSQYETAAAQIPQIELAIAQTENAISILLGRNPGPIARGKSINELALPVVPAGIPSQVLNRRPDISQAEQNLIGANAQIGAAKALYFPTISLTGLFGVASGDLSDLFKGSAKTWSFGGSVTGPIFTGGSIRGQVAQAEAANKANLYAYQAAIQSAFRDVENALVSRQQYAAQLAAQLRLVHALAEYARLAKLQYDVGYESYTTVLQAEQQLFPAELTAVQVRSSLYNSLVSIYQSMGGGWVDIAERKADTPAQAQEPAKSTAAPTKSTDAGPAKSPDAPSKTPDAAPNNPVVPVKTAAPPERKNGPDRIEVALDGDASVVNVYRVNGNGGAQVRAPKGGWPSQVLVRLHGFSNLASFQATAGGETLACEFKTTQSAPSQRNCMLGSTPVDVMTRSGTYYQVKLPALFLTSDRTPVEMHWAD